MYTLLLLFLINLEVNPQKCLTLILLVKYNTKYINKNKNLHYSCIVLYNLRYF